MSWDDLYGAVTEFNTNMPTASPSHTCRLSQGSVSVHSSSLERRQIFLSAQTIRPERSYVTVEEIERSVASQGYDEVTDIIYIKLKCLIFRLLHFLLSEINMQTQV